MEKPEKPSEDYPLFAHARGYWAKKIGGKLHYFGKWSDPQAALQSYQQFITTGRKTQGPNGCTRTTTRTPRKPKKPYAGFPLTPHPSGQWCKRIDGRLRYFGSWDDPKCALLNYTQTRLARETGFSPDYVDGYTIANLCTDYIDHCKSSVEDGELTLRQQHTYERICHDIREVLKDNTVVESVLPADFSRLRKHIARGKRKRLNPKTLQYRLAMARAVFNWALGNELIERVRFGREFDDPKERELRASRQARGSRKFSPEELRSILLAAPPQIRAMTLLAINCGFGNVDVAWLTPVDLDLENRWHDYPRQKTKVSRRARLWPETVSAVRFLLRSLADVAEDTNVSLQEWYTTGQAKRLLGFSHWNAIYKLLGRTPSAGKKDNGQWLIRGEAIAQHLLQQVRPPADPEFNDPEHGSAAELIFRTRAGRAWVYYSPNRKDRQDSLGQEFDKLLVAKGLKRPGLSFYSIRHTFQTVGDESGHPLAVKFMMGHAPNRFDISTTYREEFGDSVLDYVCRFVRAWLFGEDFNGDDGNWLDDQAS